MGYKDFEWKRRHVVLAVVLGTMVRIAFGMHTRLWMGAPDQMVWELGLRDILENGNWSYKQLIHYPHEGGSFFLSLLALPLLSLDWGMPALSIIGLILDAS